MFKGLGNIASLMKQAQEMGSRLQEAGEQLKHKRVEATAGGGLVKVEINGAQEVLGITVDPQLLADNDRELLEDLLVAAVNQGLQKSKQMQMEAMQSLSGGVNLPGMDEMLSKFTGDSPDKPEQR